MGGVLEELTVIGALVAAMLKVSLENRRNSYCPATEGIAKVRVVLVTGLPGLLWEPLRYCQ